MNIADKIILQEVLINLIICCGELEYRCLNFEFETLDVENYQCNAVIKYTDAKTPFTKIIKHTF